MVALIFGQDEALAEWAARQLWNVGAAGFGPCKAIGLAASKEPEAAFYGVCIYHEHRPQARTIQISFVAASPKWATRGTIRALLSYPFNQLGCYKVWLAIPVDNARALRFNLGIGMKREAILRHQFGRKRHAVIVSMTEPEYRQSKWNTLIGLKAAA